MNTLYRRQRIEGILADWFRREGWYVDRVGLARLSDLDEFTGEGTEVDLDLVRLADFLEREIERALA